LISHMPFADCHVFVLRRISATRTKKQYRLCMTIKICSFFQLKVQIPACAGTTLALSLISTSYFMEVPKSCCQSLLALSPSLRPAAAGWRSNLLYQLQVVLVRNSDGFVPYHDGCYPTIFYNILIEVRE
jgi:hypothetical protein